ncbi:MAG: hypothetical protein QOK29_1623 [Rhodospirillaceae bacterium]|nr:hypothetical protein [Rhodospirillaceae bacterium]
MSKLKNSWRPLAAVACLSLLVACNDYDRQQPQASAVSNNTSPLRMMPTDAGNVLSTPSGMTLYTYDKDVLGQSNCYGKCAEYWPPFLGDATSRPAGSLTLISRSDGTMQWADNGKPLYTFVQDENHGDVKGDNFHTVWHVVR